LKRYFREVKVQTSFYQIDDIHEEGKDLPYKSDLSGYLGIAPYTADEDNKERNFLW